MSMSKKDFDLLADSLAAQEFKYRGNQAVRKAIAEVRNELVWTLQAQYGEAFNRKKFWNRYADAYAQHARTETQSNPNRGNCSNCHERVVRTERFGWVHMGSGDPECWTGDGAMANPVVKS